MNNDIIPDKEKALQENKKLQQLRSMKEILAEQEQPRVDTTLQQVYDTISKWLGIRIQDTKRIDVALAVALSNKIPGTPLWVFFVGASGDWKSAYIRAFEGLPNSKQIDQLTENTLASGKKDELDLGSELHNKSTILVFPDLASLTSMNTDKKNMVWGQFRNLYDGFINKKTGSGVNKKYENCHVTILACATQSLRDEILIFSQLGTRELIWDTDMNPVDNSFKMDKAIHNEQYEQQMMNEIKKVVCDFVFYHPVKEIALSDELINYMKAEANRLSILRVSGAVDTMHRELINPLCPEVPTRLIKQFIRLARCLKSLDADYPDERVKQIITHVVNSTGHKVRQIIFEFMENHPDSWYKISEVQFNTKLGKNSVKTQLEMLWNLDIIEKDVREDRVGAYLSVNEYTGKEELRGGMVKEVAYYRFKGLPSHSTDTTPGFTDTNRNPLTYPLPTTLQHNIYMGGRSRGNGSTDMGGE